MSADEEEEDSEDARASRREDRVWGCDWDLIGCGFDLAILLLIPLGVLLI